MIIQKAESNNTDFSPSLLRCKNLKNRKKHFQTSCDSLQIHKFSSTLTPSHILYTASRWWSRATVRLLLKDSVSVQAPSAYKENIAGVVLGLYEAPVTAWIQAWKHCMLQTGQHRGCFTPVSSSAYQEQQHYSCCTEVKVTPILLEQALYYHSNRSMMEHFWFCCLTGFFGRAR